MPSRPHHQADLFAPPVTNLTTTSPPSLVARLRAASGRLAERLRHAYDAELIAMLPEEDENGTRRHWPMAPPGSVHPLAPLLRPHVWQIGLPVTIASMIGSVMRQQANGIDFYLAPMLFGGIFSFLFWSWIGRKLFGRHWTRLGIEAYNRWCWRKLREKDLVALAPPPEEPARGKPRRRKPLFDWTGRGS